MGEAPGAQPAPLEKAFPLEKNAGRCGHGSRCRGRPTSESSLERQALLDGCIAAYLRGSTAALLAS